MHLAGDGDGGLGRELSDVEADNGTHRHWWDGSVRHIVELGTNLT